MTNEQLARALRTWRARGGHTQEKAAQQFGVCLRTYMRWEGGGSRPGPLKAPDVAAELGVDPFVVLVPPGRGVE